MSTTSPVASRFRSPDRSLRVLTFFWFAVFTPFFLIIALFATPAWWLVAAALGAVAATMAVVITFMLGMLDEGDPRGTPMGEYVPVEHLVAEPAVLAAPEPAETPEPAPAPAAAPTPPRVPAGMGGRIAGAH